MLANPKWLKIALILNLAGTIILFYSFQATSSDFRLVTAPVQSGHPSPPNQMLIVPSAGNFPPADKQYALCINNYTLFSTDAKAGIRMAYAGCPDWEHAKPAAVVNIEHPRFEGLGFLLLVFGFGLQYFAVPQPATIAYLRNELKKARMEEKLKKEHTNKDSVASGHVDNNPDVLPLLSLPRFGLSASMNSHSRP